MNGAATAGRFGGAQVNGSARANAQAGNSGAHNNMRTSGQFENRPGNNGPANSGNSGMTSRQRELSQNRPPSATSNGPAGNNNSSQRAGNGRTWEAQGNATDRGRAPQGFGSDRPSNAPAQNSPRSMGDRPAQNGAGSTSPHARVMSDRPPWAGNGGPRGGNSGPSNGNRGYTQQPSYSPRTYSAPSRSYPAPSRSYSPPPSRSYGGGGGNSAPRSYGGGGGSPRSYGGGGGYSGGSPRSYGGGGGSSGGSHSSGGGGHVSSGGGSHSSGGGGGSHGGGGGHPHR